MEGCSKLGVGASISGWDAATEGTQNMSTSSTPLGKEAGWPTLEAIAIPVLCSLWRVVAASQGKAGKAWAALW